MQDAYHAQLTNNNEIIESEKCKCDCMGEISDFTRMLNQLIAEVEDESNHDHDVHTDHDHESDSDKPTDIVHKDSPIISKEKEVLASDIENIRMQISLERELYELKQIKYNEQLNLNRQRIRLQLESRKHKEQDERELEQFKDEVIHIDVSEEKAGPTYSSPETFQPKKLSWGPYMIHSDLSDFPKLCWCVIA